MTEHIYVTGPRRIETEFKVFRTVPMTLERFLIAMADHPRADYTQEHIEFWKMMARRGDVAYREYFDERFEKGQLVSEDHQVDGEVNSWLRKED